MKTERRCLTAIPALLGTIMATSPAQAASCTVAAQGVPFGSYDPFASSDLNGVGNLQVVCDVATPVQISLSTGAGDYSARTMRSGSGSLAYNLYADPLRSMVWGDGTGGSTTMSASQVTIDIPVYGSVAARQNPVPGAYSDTIIVTVTY